LPSNLLSVSEWTLRPDTTAEAIERVARVGYPAIELAATRELDVIEARELADEYGLSISSLCALEDPDRDFAHESERLRRNAGEYLRNSLQQAHELGAPVLIVVPSYRPDGDPTYREAELERAAATIGAAAQTTGPEGPTIALEALNRYETNLITRLEDADALRQLIDLPNVAITANVFHMDIEEDSIPDSLTVYAEQIVHVHLADNQRREPGSGHLDFQGVFRTLAETGYGGALAMEFFPATDLALIAGRKWVEAAQKVP
jgi:D-psicose/D-tagatose/L-ribulose 3-epimerase